MILIIDKEKKYNAEMLASHSDKLYRVNAFYTASEVRDFCKYLTDEENLQVNLLENKSIPDFIATNYYIAVNDTQRKIMIEKIKHLVSVLNKHKAYYERCLASIAKDLEKRNIKIENGSECL